MKEAKVPRLLRIVSLAIATALGGCGDEGPVPGLLTVSVTSPNAGDAAIVVVVSGPGPMTTAEAASPSNLVFSRPASSNMLRAAVFGDVRSGPLLRFSVPDVGQAQAYAASVLEVADITGALRQSTSEYRVVVGR